MRPKVFIGSTSEGKKYAEAIVSLLGRSVQCKPWYQGVFEVAGTTQTSLLREVADCDFAIIVLTADDESNVRGSRYFTPRDNLIFEAGLSFAAVHPSRTFLVPEHRPSFKLPSDLNGFTTTAPFDRSTPAMQAMAAPVASVKQRIIELGRKPIQHHSGGPETLTSAAIDLLSSAGHSIILFGGDLSWAPNYTKIIAKKRDAGVSVEVFSDKASQERAEKNVDCLVKIGAQVHYCELDLGLKLTLIDHHAIDVSQFMLSFKERNPSYHGSSSRVHPFLYNFSIHDARHNKPLWCTLVRLYQALKAETAVKG